MIESKADIIVIGEGELTVLELARYYLLSKGKLSEINGIRYILNNQLFETPKRKTIANLDEIPFPNKKHSLNTQFRNKDKVTILTGRGCPFKCTFCFEAKDKLRIRSIDNVFNEIDIVIKENPNLLSLILVDDTFTLNKKRIFDFCNKIKERRKNNDFIWSCEAHISTLLKNPEIIEEMVKNGLVRMQIGIESGDDDVLKLYNKQISVDNIKEFIKICKELNVPQIAANFIIGGANESYKSIMNSMKLAEELLETGKGMLDIFTSFFFAYPFTEITKKPNNFNMEIFDSNSFTSMSDYVVVKTNLLTKYEIFEIKQKFDNSIYYKIKEIIKKLTFQEIYNQYYFANKYNMKSVWYHYLTTYQHINTFFTYLISKAGFIFSEIENNIAIYKPLRTFSMENIYIENECIIYENYIFTKVQTLLIEYSTAKLNINEISILLNLEEHYIIEEYKKLNEQYFIIFVEW